MKVTVTTTDPDRVSLTDQQTISQLPSSWFPEPVRTGQVWDLTLTHEFSYAEQVELLNSYLAAE